MPLLGVWFMGWTIIGQVLHWDESFLCLCLVRSVLVHFISSLLWLSLLQIHPCLLCDFLVEEMVESYRRINCHFWVPFLCTHGLILYCLCNHDCIWGNLYFPCSFLFPKPLISLLTTGEFFSGIIVDVQIAAICCDTDLRPSRLDFLLHVILKLLSRCFICCAWEVFFYLISKSMVLASSIAIVLFIDVS